MSSLGIYFGPKVISIVETKGKRLSSSIQIPLSLVSSGSLEEKVPEELKIATLLRDELAKNKVEAREAVLVLSGRDLIIRTFEMPLLPAEELRQAVNFEARKYIPFKMEELVCDYQLKVDRLSRRNFVLFMGIKKDALDKYIAMLGQLNIKVASIEYSAFGVTRLLQLCGFRDKGVITLVNVDLIEKDEVNFVVMENGMPLLSRDITITESGGADETAATKEEAESETARDELRKRMSMTLDHYNREFIKREIRISLDYYNRKFPTKAITKAFFVTSESLRSDLEFFAREIGLSDTGFVDINKCVDKSVPFSLSFIKAYGGSLGKLIKTGIKIDLLAARGRAKVARAAGVSPQLAIPLMRGLKVSPRVAALAAFICIATFVFGLYRKLPLEKELNNILSLRPPVATVSPDLNYDGLTRTVVEYKNKLGTVDSIIKNQANLTGLLDAIPRLMPRGMWLTTLSFVSKEGKSEFLLAGNVRLSDNDAEFQAVNQFLSSLKESEAITRYFSELSIVSVDRKVIEVGPVTNFEILLRNQR